MNKENKRDKKNWEKPTLTVLVRNKPEEQVLTACKVTGYAISPGTTAGDCTPTNCALCEAAGAS